MALSEAQDCGHCKFWSKRTDGTSEMGGGYCRRYPPFFPSGLRLWMTGAATADLESSSEFLNDAWPNVHQSQWCGEFLPAGRAALGEKDSE